MSPFPRRALRIAVAASALVAGTVAALTVSASTAHAETVTLGVNDKIVVTMRGNGHGHGLSQYGARGAAIKGLGYAAIVGYYYPGTTLTTLPVTAIRVRLAQATGTTTVGPARGLRVTGVAGTLPYTGVRRYRLVTDKGSGLTLQRLLTAAGAVWQTVRTGLPNGASLYVDKSTTRLFDPTGSTAYRGFLTSYRVRATGTAGGVYTVNRVTLDDYTAAVTPRESPASWQRQAVLAQSVAARSYGRYAVEHPSNSRYDICDSSACQVYGGAARYDSANRVQWTEFPDAGTATANKVLRYKGKTIFAQFSASHGGWSSDGGQPYLVAKQDIYDTAASGDPYLDYTTTVTGKSLASQFGLVSLSKLVITRRDGAGPWGGRVLAATLTGRTSAGAARTVPVAGYELQSAFDSGTALFTVRRA